MTAASHAVAVSMRSDSGGALWSAVLAASRVASSSSSRWTSVVCAAASVNEVNAGCRASTHAGALCMVNEAVQTACNMAVGPWSNKRPSAGIDAWQIGA